MTETYVITPDFNGTKFLHKYFKSLFNQTYEDFKIVFVDNSPNDDSINYIKENYSDLAFNKILIIKNPENYGFAEANNIGIKEAFKDGECKYIICLNNDIEAKPYFLEELIKCADIRPEAGSIQAKMIWGLKPEFIDSVGLEYSKNGLGFNRGTGESSKKYNEEEEIFGCCAGACLYKKSALEDVRIDDDYFDSDFFAYYEDFDLALRLRWAGWSAWYCPKSVVYHHKGGTEGALSNFTVYHNWRNYTWNLFKNMPGSFILKHFHLIFLSELSQIGISLLRGKPVILKAKLDAYSNINKFLEKNKKINKRVPFEEIEKFLTLKWKAKVQKQ
jgi:GT2 family glycosyltransferase